jgi:hypothetical protein
MEESRSALNGVVGMIEEWLGVAGIADYGDSQQDPKPKYASKKAAIDLSAEGGPLGGTTDKNLLVELLNRINTNWRQGGCRDPSDETWTLGKEERLSPESKSQEVILERLIVRLLGETWTNQLPTCSGLIPGASEGRRSIDLVHDCGGGAYEFIELKFKDGTDGEHGSNNPLDTAWEILGYGLLYAHARRNNLRSESTLMKASTIHLVVLAPAGWYLAAPDKPYNFEWLETRINRWLADETFSELVKMDFQFQRFTQRFEEIYIYPQPLPTAIQEFRQSDLRDREPVYGAAETATSR